MEPILQRLHPAVARRPRDLPVRARRDRHPRPIDPARRGYRAAMKNIASGIKETLRSGEYSERVAYAWDLDSRYYDERQFQVRHWRDTQKGGYPLTDERDLYELIANFGQRRKRAVLYGCPGVTRSRRRSSRRAHDDLAADVTPEGVKSWSRLSPNSALPSRRSRRGSNAGSTLSGPRRSSCSARFYFAQGRDERAGGCFEAVALCSPRLNSRPGAGGAPLAARVYRPQGSNPRVQSPSRSRNRRRRHPVVGKFSSRCSRGEEHGDQHQRL